MATDTANITLADLLTEFGIKPSEYRKPAQPIDSLRTAGTITRNGKTVEILLTHPDSITANPDVSAIYRDAFSRALAELES